VTGVVFPGRKVRSKVRFRGARRLLEFARDEDGML
jgi:hypothetical protein